MVNKRFLQAAERWKNKDLPTETQGARPKTHPTIPGQSIPFSDFPAESFIFGYEHPQHGQFFQELIRKSNERFKGTRAEIPAGNSGEVKNMHLAKRMALISTIAGDSNLRSYGLWPITPMQSESLLKAGKLPNPSKYWEDLALLLYDINGSNQNEARALKEDIAKHREELGLSQNDLEKRLVIANPGAEPDQSMAYGIKPVIVPGITIVYPHEILDMTGKNHSFEYGLSKGLPAVSQIGKGNRTLYMPGSNENIGLRVLYRYRVLYLYAWYVNLAVSNVGGRVNFAPQGHAPRNRRK